MSLSAVNSIATSTLSAAQYQMSVTASNIANADSEGYTKKVSTLTASVSGGVSNGVSSARLQSLVNTLLSKQMTAAASALGGASVTAQYADSLQAFYGDISSSDGAGTSIANSLSDLETALTELAGTPESESLKASVLSALKDLTAQFNDLSKSIQTLRSDADSAIATAVDEANTYIDMIGDMNDEIVSAKARGDSSADLEDQRASALLALSEIMDISYTETSTGATLVYTADTSHALVKASSTNLLEFSKAAFVSADTSYPSGLSGIVIDGKDISASIGSGSLSSLIDQRDTVLVDAQDEIDELARTLIDRINATSNAGNASPPATTLTGTTTVDGSDGFSATGTTRIAVVDKAGSLVSYADLDLTGYSTVGDLVTAIDAINGLSASIDGDGHLTISADDPANGIALAGLDGAIDGEAKTLSSFFGLNDLLTGTGAGSISVAASRASASSLMPTATLSDDTTLTLGDTVLSSGDTSIAQALSDVLQGDVTFSAAGGMGQTTTTFAEYMSSVITDKATAVSRADSALETKQSAYETIKTAQASASGVNVDEETERLSELEQLFSLAAQMLQITRDMFNTLLAAVD